MTVTVAEVVAVLEDLYDPRAAAPWDAVGLVTGNPDHEVRRMLLAVDPVGVVIDEALAWGADLILTHHPLLLRPVHGVAAISPKGRAVTSLVQAQVALYVAHTNADVAAPGVSDALAAALGLVDLRPLQPDAAGSDQRRGLGRVGRLPAATSLREFAAAVERGLPRVPAGIRVAGDPDLAVETVAVCGGAGDDLFDEVRRRGADVYVTADLRHHPASEAREHGQPALVDCSHWATEWPWLGDVARLLRSGLGGAADTVETRISTIVTDPWTSHRRSST